MTRYISPANLTMLAGNELTLCKCVKLTLRDGTVKGFTDHDADLTISAVVYRSNVGLSVGAMRWTNKISDEKTELSGVFSSETGGLTEALARIGYYNEATVDIFLANWATPALVVPLKRGTLASITPKGARYVAEVRSLAYPLSKRQIVGEITQECSAELGDAECTFPTNAEVGTITSATATTVTDTGFVWAGADADLIGGRFQLTSGSLQWFNNKIKSYDSGTDTFTFVRPFPVVPTVGWTFRAYEGCPKTAAVCLSRFSNLVNFRGFPFVPDRDKLKASKTLDTSSGGYAVGTGEDD